jgi:hypothetical protein
MALIPIAKKNWVYTLYKNEEKYILSVICGGVAIYELNIELTNEEKNKFLENNEYLKKYQTK